MTRTDSPLVEHSKNANTTGKENTSKKRSKRKLTKEERLLRNKKGWMEGMREKALQPLVTEYADALLSGSKAEKVKMREILSKFHFWFPYPLCDHEEPLELAPYNPHYVAPEGDLEFEAAKGAHLKLYNKRVKAWIKARVPKPATQEAKVKRAPTEPFNILMARLANKTKPPRGRSGQQQWQKNNWVTGAMVEAVVLEEWQRETGVRVSAGIILPEGSEGDEEGREEGEVEGVGPTSSRGVESEGDYPKIDFIAKVAGRLFKALPVEEQARWKADAREEARVEREAYEASLLLPLGGDATSRAMCVRNAPEFISKINRGIEMSSSLRLTTLAAGPMARKKGDVGFFMVTTSTNRAAVPVSFQEWYGEEKMNALMESYKEWAQSCLSPGEIEEVMGSGSGEAHLVEAYSGSLGKGFTTDDGRAEQAQPPALTTRFEAISNIQPTGKQVNARRTPEQEGTTSKKSRSKRGRRKGSDGRSHKEGEAEDSASTDSDSDLDDWSEKSSSEDSAMDSDSSNDTDGDVPEEGGVVGVVKRKRMERTEHRKRKRASRHEEPSRKSSRKSKNSFATTVQGMDKESSGRDMGGEGNGDVEHTLPRLRNDSTSEALPAFGGTPMIDDPLALPTTPERLPTPLPTTPLPTTPLPTTPLPTTPLPTTPERLPTPLPTTPERLPTPLPTTPLPTTPLPTTPEEASRTSLPTSPQTPPKDVQDPNDMVRDIITRLWPDARLGLEKNTLQIASGLDSVAGVVMCDKSGLEFLLLPFNEFWQAPGGERLKGIMESLIAIEMIFLDGYVSDTKGRKKAVLPVSTRPRVLSAWIGKGCCRLGQTGAPMPRIVIKSGELEVFVNIWKIWWTAVQPAWRSRQEMEGWWEREMYGDDWHTLTIPGQNGLLSVVATLSWWGSAVSLAGEGEAEWWEAVADVEWMLESRKT